MALFKLNDDSLLASVDAGSYSVRCTVFKKSNKLPFKVLAFVEEKSFGLEESRVVDFESLSMAFGEVLSKAEELCGSSFSEVYLGFSPPFYSFRSKGMAVLPTKEVRKKDLDLAIETASAVSLPYQSICLHRRAEFFCVDSQKEILNPLGLSGLRLEVELRLINVLESYCKDMGRVLKVLGYKPKSFFHNLIVFGEHLISMDQKKNGVCFCDIGHKSTRVVVYDKNKIQNIFSVPMGGYHFTKALANRFNIAFSSAEELKHQHGRLLFRFQNEKESIQLNGSDKYLPFETVIQCLETQFEQLFEEIKSHFTEDSLSKLSSGFVFTGASSHIQGFKEFAGFYLGQPVSYPKTFYEDIKKTQALSLVQQAYMENQVEKSRKDLFQRFSSLKELF